MELMNATILSEQMGKGVYQYFKLRLNIASQIFVAMICGICIHSQGSVNPILLGLLMTYSMGIQVNLTILLNIHSHIEKLMVCAERCMLMTTVPQEMESEDKVAARPNWPEEGKIEFQGVNLKYRPTTDIVLNNLTFNVQPKEKIGIVGRTGSGKSTICISISRIVELFSGKI